MRVSMWTRVDARARHLGRSQAALLHVDLGGRSLDAAQLLGLAVGQGLHGGEADVEPCGAVVDSQDVDLEAVVLEAPASCSE
jgi:hypothetical protein